MISENNEILTVENIKKSLQIFGITDYLVFCIMLLICSIIGYYFGFIEKTKNQSNVQNLEDNSNTEAINYLLGNREMKILPVSLSLAASYISGISLLGNSTEIYIFGTQFSFTLMTLLFAGLLSWYVFLPVFCGLQLTSLYEYLEIRYNRRIRLLASIINVIGIVFWLAIVVYIPGLVFNQITGIDVHTITPIVCIVCIFYTCVGGLKAVIWTDVFQSFIMIGSVMIVAIKGTVDIGGLSEVLRRNYEGDRLDYPEMTLDPTVRFSILSVLIGGGLSWTQDACLGQVMMQRFLSVPTVKEARKVLILFIIGITILIGCCMYNGLLIYATFYNCDPLSTSLAKVKDQLLPLLVMQVLGKISGLPGIFVAGIISAALSTLSTGLNSLSAIFLEDLLKPLLKSPLNRRQTAITMRLIVIIFGLICYSLVSVIEKLGMIFQLSQTLGSVTNGSILGLFLMGVFMPWINAKSALAGGIFGFSVMCWISINAQIAIATGEMVYLEKPVKTDGCTYTFNTTDFDAENITNSTGEITKSLYHISFMWYSPLGALLSIIGAHLTSLIFGQIKSKDWNPKVVAPFLRKYISSIKNQKNHNIDNNNEINAFIST